MAMVPGVRVRSIPTRVATQSFCTASRTGTMAGVASTRHAVTRRATSKLALNTSRVNQNTKTRPTLHPPGVGTVRAILPPP
jgi:hypothetical protein